MKRIPILFFSLVLSVGVFFSCKDSSEVNFQPFDPSKPIEVTDFYPCTSSN